MQTHRDDDAKDPRTDEFKRVLQERAEFMLKKKASKIASAGIDEPLEHWKHQGLHIRKLSDDSQDILRISIGGRPDIKDYETLYCTFRGDMDACIALLEKALGGLRHRKRKGI